MDQQGYFVKLLSTNRCYWSDKYPQEARHQPINQLECGPMPNVMVALPNVGGALCSTPQSMTDAHY